MLGLPEHQVRVIAPDVGGGFGPKNPFYPEEVVIPAAACLIRQPIKWVEDRREAFTATNHEREQLWDVEVADYTKGYSLTAAPLVVKNKVIVGMAGGEYGLCQFTTETA